MSAEILLQATLEAAVPFWAAELARMPVSYIYERRTYCAHFVAEHGDDILFRSRRTGGSSAAFNALAEGIAILSFAPGGVRFLGLHFDNRHPEIPK